MDLGNIMDEFYDISGSGTLQLDHKCAPVDPLIGSLSCSRLQGNGPAASP